MLLSSTTDPFFVNSTVISAFSDFNQLLFTNTSSDASMYSSPTLMSSIITQSFDSLMTSHVVFPASSDGARLDIYLTSVLGLPRVFLTSYHGALDAKVDNISVCVPEGSYRIMFVPYMDSSVAIGLGPVSVTTERCTSSYLAVSLGEHSLCDVA